MLGWLNNNNKDIVSSSGYKQYNEWNKLLVTYAKAAEESGYVVCLCTRLILHSRSFTQSFRVEHMLISLRQQRKDTLRVDPH